jgi:hypothetical protein
MMNERDQLALGALTGLLAKAEYDYDPERFAERAYTLADAMLAFRVKPSEETAVRLEQQEGFIGKFVTTIGSVELDQNSSVPALTINTGDPAYPDPTSADLQDPQFNAIWEAIKGWDLSRQSELYRTYSGATGNDVMHIMLELRKQQLEHDAIARLQELHRLWNDLGVKAKYGYDSDKLDRIEELLKPYWTPEQPEASEP